MSLQTVPPSDLGKRILVIEDDPDLREALGDIRRDGLHLRTIEFYCGYSG